MIVATDNDEVIGEYQVAEYLIFVLALDTYMRYAEEATGQEDVEDEIINVGLKILRLADVELDRLQSYLDEHLPSPTHKAMLSRAFAFRATSPEGASRRALMLRTLLSRGGPATMKGIFTNMKYIRQAREAISAAMLDNADKALDVFASIPVHNVRMRDWIDGAAKQAGSGVSAPLPVDAASNEGSNTANEIVIQNVQQMAAVGAAEAQEAQQARSALLAKVQVDATEAAAKSLLINNEPDVPLKRSEVVGVAVAAAVAAASDPSKPQNIPEPLRDLDEEQLAAALTDGRTLVSAGAGSGKTKTVASRVAYLVKDRKTYPSRILVTSFNKKSSIELKERIEGRIGHSAANQMSIGTMNSLFKRFVRDYGTHEEKVMLGAYSKSSGKPNAFVGAGTPVARAVQKIWQECYGEDDPPPKLKEAVLARTQWAGNDVTPAQAREQANSHKTNALAMWYEMYEGLKGAIPGWKPPCEANAYNRFMGKFRPNDVRLGDFTDQIKVFRDLMLRDSGVRASVQQVFDHIIVDEGQDRNTVMAECLELMAGKITDGADGKSYWVVGDDKQAINSFQGARSSLFVELASKEGWKVREIRTNYRCEPEVVEAANKLISYNDDQIPFVARPNPKKVRGMGSIRVSIEDDEPQSALRVVEDIKENQALGVELNKNAVLTRTNNEINAFETACIIRGIPYARKGASSFFGSPETTAMLGYVQILTGSNFSKMQTSLGNIINNPNRFFLKDPSKARDAVDAAIEKHARRQGVDVRTVNPLQALKTKAFRQDLGDELAKYTRTGSNFRFEERIQDLAWSLDEMKARTSDPEYTTANLFDEILGLKGVAYIGGETVPQSFRDSLRGAVRDQLGGDDDEEVGDGGGDEDEDGGENLDTKGLGNIPFLYQLAKIDPTDDDDSANPPTTPQGFRAKMERYAGRMRDLRTDLDEHYRKQKTETDPEKKGPPAGVYLGTVHSTKGAEWPNVYVSMPKSKWPMLPPVKPGEPPPDPEEIEQKIRDERRLAYVAVTRAMKNLMIVCPDVVGGSPGGVSTFVHEAGLHEGENVPKPETPPSEQVKQAFDVSKVSWEDV